MLDPTCQFTRMLAKKFGIFMLETYRALEN